MGPEPVAIVEHPSGVNINFILNTSADASPTNVLMDAGVKHMRAAHGVALSSWSGEPENLSANLIGPKHPEAALPGRFEC